jgi:ATP-dependent exoDNAse (exonuclease V) beta subunit
MFAARERHEELAERKRMLYVATTRARDRLILSSSLEAHDKPASDWMKLLAERFDLQTGNTLAKLPFEAEPPEIQVTPDMPPREKPAGRSRGADLLQMLADVQQLAADGSAVIPAGVAPIPVNRAARRQFSFSRLTGKIISTRPVTAAGSPNEDSAPQLDARGLGSLVHDCLARIDFGRADSAAQIAEWCEHLAPQHVVHQVSEAARLAAGMITNFANSPRGNQLASAAVLHREVEFLLAWPPTAETAPPAKIVKTVRPPTPKSRSRQQLLFTDATESPPDHSMIQASQTHDHGTAATVGRYIRGYIDCLYQDDAGLWRIVDYKTNEVSPSEVAKLVRRYEMQLYVYALAAERALGTAPKELVLELLRSGTEHVIAWNDQARARAINLVNSAIESAIRDPDSENEIL